MGTAIRIHTKVLPGHRIEVTAPQLLEGAAVDVLLVPSEQAAQPNTRHEMLQMPIEARRRLLVEQSDLLVAHYEHPESDSERSDWQGGDIV